MVQQERLRALGEMASGIAHDINNAIVPVGLYTESLFAWRPRPGDLLGPALELGRSFIRPEYQRDPSALLLLWKAIGAFAARHPRYRRLFGPVSISATYHPVSRDLIAAWLERHAWSRAAGEVPGHQR